MNAVDLLILALRLVLVGLLYLFLFAVLRLAIGGLRDPAATSGPQAARALKLRLQVVEPGESELSSGQILEIADGTTLGRDQRADMALGDTSISGTHAQLSHVGRHWAVTDLGSTNGTRVNEGLIKGRTSLAEGDVLALGTVRLRVLGAARN